MQNPLIPQGHWKQGRKVTNKLQFGGTLQCS